jgi:hypothetical protein
MDHPMHDLTGKAMFWDRMERVHLDCDLDLEVTPTKARVFVGELGGDGESRDSGETVFRRPEVVSALGIIAQMIKARKAYLAARENPPETGPVPVFQFPDPVKVTCPACHHRGWLEDNEENLRRCPFCGGLGVIPEW